MMGDAIFLPIDSLLYHCAYCIHVRKNDGESLLVIVPLIE